MKRERESERQRARANDLKWLPCDRKSYTEIKTRQINTTLIEKNHCVIILLGRYDSMKKYVDRLKAKHTLQGKNKKRHPSIEYA